MLLRLIVTDIVEKQINNTRCFTTSQLSNVIQIEWFPIKTFKKPTVTTRQCSTVNEITWKKEIGIRKSKNLENSFLMQEGTLIPKLLF